MRNLFLFVFLFFSAFAGYNSHAQELRAKVIFQLTSELNQTNQQIFKNLEKDLTSWVNSYSFTDENWAVEEQIECSFVFTVDKYEGDVINARLQVSSSRPVFNSTYKTPLLNLQDNNIVFYYIAGQPLDFNINNTQSNLMAIMGYYGYIILGVDRDTYTKGGGKAYYQLAQRVTQNAQSSGGSPGWNSFGTSKNRYWLVENLMNNNFENIIGCLYEYHRNGLDLMYKESNHQLAKENIADALIKFQETFQKRPSSYLMQAFFDAKRDEIINIFSGGPPVDLTQLVAVLKAVDGAKASEYQKLQK